MSGTGQTNTQAPTRLTPITQDQPIVDPATGKPTNYFGQAFARVLAYLGQPATTTTTIGNGLTVTEQLNSLTTSVEILQAAAAGNTPQSGTISRIAALENTVRNILRYQRTPRVITKPRVIPAAPPQPNLTPAMIMSWWTQ